MDYTELVQNVQDFTQNEEATFVSRIPTFVRQAEERILRSVLIPELRKNVSGSCTTGNSYLARPEDFIAPASVAIISGGSHVFLDQKDVSFIREAYPSPTATGTPTHYALFDGDSATAGTHGNLLLGPTPDADYTVELHYYFDPPSIVDSSTSWLGDNAETALLYGTLIEAYTFMKGDADVMAAYVERYTDGMRKLGAVDALTNRDTYRSDPRNA